MSAAVVPAGRATAPRKQSFGNSVARRPIRNPGSPPSESCHPTLPSGPRTPMENAIVASRVAAQASRVAKRRGSGNYPIPGLPAIDAAFPPDFPSADRIGPGIRVHDRLARGVGQLEGHGGRGEAQGPLTPIAEHVVVGHDIEHRMAGFVAPREGKQFVLGALVLLGDHPAGRIELHAVYVLEVGEAAPRSHQSIGGRAAVLVAEHDGVTQSRPTPRERLRLDPHHEGHVTETAERVRPGFEHRGVGQELFLGAGKEGRAKGERLDRGSSHRSAGSLRVQGEAQPVRTRAEAPQGDPVLCDLAPSRQQEVLRVTTVQPQLERSRFVVAPAPVASTAGGGDEGDHLRRNVQGEGRLLGAGGVGDRCNRQGRGARAGRAQPGEAGPGPGSMRRAV